MKSYGKYIGDDLPMGVDIAVEGLTDTVSGATGWFTVKRYKTQPDTEALIAKSTALGDGIDPIPPTRFEWVISAGDEALITDDLVGKKLHWDFQYKGADGRVKTTDEGTLTYERGVTRRS